MAEEQINPSGEGSAPHEPSTGITPPPPLNQQNETPEIEDVLIKAAEGGDAGGIDVADMLLQPAFTEETAPAPIGPTEVASAQEELSGLSLDRTAEAQIEIAEDDVALPDNVFLADKDAIDVISIARSALASSMGDDTGFFLPTDEPEADPQKIRAYAKIEFDDGQFYMDTYSVELGRDVRAAKRAHYRQIQDNITERERTRRGSHSSDEISHHRYAPSSAVSETGGIVNYETSERKRHRRSRKGSMSPSSSSFSRSRQNSMMQPVEPFDYQQYAHQNADLGEASPYACPLIPVHPPVISDSRKTGYGGISRRHARISYNFDENWFEFEVLGRNGAFVDDDFVDSAQVAVLEHGSRIQIGGVSMTFLLPNQSEAGMETMSFDFEDGRGESLPVLDTSTSPSSEAQSPLSSNRDSDSEDEEGSDDSGDSESDEDDEEEEEVELDEDGIPLAEENLDAPKKPKKLKKSESRHRSSEKKRKLKLKLKLKMDRKGKAKQEAREKQQKAKGNGDSQERSEPPQRDPEALKSIADKLGIEVDELPARRKGPGRPPKDGIMSKREYAQLARQQKERAKAEGVPPGSSKASKTINGLMTSTMGEKRKYTKRKKADDEDGEGDDVKESVEGGDGADGASGAGRTVKEKRATKPPRSPSPELDKSMFTAEQLAKPTQSYVVLIHEALSSEATGQLSLPQIYKKIEKRYPYFKFGVQTVGWQSSVRHNLSQHPAFRKVEKDGKGWMWGLDPEVSIEKEKKRRPTPPPANTQPYYPPVHQPYRPDQYPYQAAAAGPSNVQPQSRMPYPYAPMPAYGPPTGLPAPYGTPTMPLAAPVATNTYQSPYAPRAPTGDQPSASSPSQNGVSQAQHNLYSQNYYNGLRAPATPATPSAPANQTTASPSPYPPPPPPISMSHPFFPGVQGVHPRVIETCTRYKSLLCDSLCDTPGIAELLDRALNRALRSMMKIEDPSDQNPEQSENEVVFEEEARKVLATVWDHHQPGSQMGQPATATDTPSQPPEPPQSAQPTSAPEPASAEQATTQESADDHSTEQVIAQLQAAVKAEDKTPETASEQAKSVEAQPPTSSAEPRQSSAASNGTGTATEGALSGVLTDASQAITASREAMQKVMTSLNVGSKRSHPGEEGEQSPIAINGGVQSDSQPRPKRVAV